MLGSGGNHALKAVCGFQGGLTGRESWVCREGATTGNGALIAGVPSGKRRAIGREGRACGTALARKEGVKEEGHCRQSGKTSALSGFYVEVRRKG